MRSGKWWRAMGQKLDKTPFSEAQAATVFHQAGQRYKSDLRIFSDKCILKEEKQAFSSTGEIIPHCFVSWHHFNWWKGTFGSLYADYVFILLAEMKLMMRREIRISRGKAQEMLKQKKSSSISYPPGQESALYQDKTKSEMTEKGH